jgi:hypothetical protein
MYRYMYVCMYAYIYIYIYINMQNQSQSNFVVTARTEKYEIQIPSKIRTRYPCVWHTFLLSVSSITAVLGAWVIKRLKTEGMRVVRKDQLPFLGRL